MAKKTTYTEGPVGKANLKDLVRVPDFLPAPEEIARRMDKTKITITLTADSIAFFKEQAEAHDLQYQLLIRHILDEYVTHHRQKEKGKRHSRELN